MSIIMAATLFLTYSGGNNISKAILYEIGNSKMRSWKLEDVLKYDLEIDGIPVSLPCTLDELLDTLGENYSVDKEGILCYNDKQTILEVYYHKEYKSRFSEWEDINDTVVNVGGLGCAYDQIFDETIREYREYNGIAFSTEHGILTLTTLAGAAPYKYADFINVYDLPNEIKIDPKSEINIDPKSIETFYFGDGEGVDDIHFLLVCQFDENYILSRLTVQNF